MDIQRMTGKTTTPMTKTLKGEDWSDFLVLKEEEPSFFCMTHQVYTHYNPPVCSLSKEVASLVLLDCDLDYGVPAVQQRATSWVCHQGKKEVSPFAKHMVWKPLCAQKWWAAAGQPYTVASLSERQICQLRTLYGCMKKNSKETVPQQCQYKVLGPN